MEGPCPELPLPAQTHPNQPRGLWGALVDGCMLKVSGLQAALPTLISRALISVAICIPTSVATFSFRSSCVREFQRDKVSGARSFPPHPTGTQHPFDQVATCPPTMKEGKEKRIHVLSKEGNFPPGCEMPCPGLRALLCGQPGSVWLWGWATPRCLDPPPE